MKHTSGVNIAYTENLDCSSPPLFLVAATGHAQEKGHVAGVFGWTFGQNFDVFAKREDLRLNRLTFAAGFCF